MSTVAIYAFAGIGLIGAGTFGLCRDTNCLRRIVAINICAVGVLTVMVSLGARGGATDPVTHAMVLTGLVVSAGATALALALARRLARLPQRTSGDDHEH